MTVLARYLLVQTPAWALVSLAALASLVWGDFPPWLVVALAATWIGKDLVLYPFLKNAYRSTASSTPADLLLGQRGVAEQDLDPDGFVRIRGELWAASLRDDVTRAPCGAAVRVFAVDGYRVLVEPDGVFCVVPGEVDR